MKQGLILFAVFSLIALVIAAVAVNETKSISDVTKLNLSQSINVQPKVLQLPQPHTASNTSLEMALNERRSIRALKANALSLDGVSQLLWAAQGITDDKGHRTAGSAWECYPLEVYVMAGNVTGVPAGLYRYVPQNHTLTQLSKGDRREGFVKSSVVQANAWIQGAPVIFIITGVFERAAVKGVNNESVYIEAGMASENFLLEVVSLGLASTYIGGFDVNNMKQFMDLENSEEPIAVLPVGRKA